MLTETTASSLSIGFNNSDIASLEADALVDVIRRADLPHLAPEVCQRLPFYDRTTLERLAYLARECTRKRLATAN